MLSSCAEPSFPSQNPSYDQYIQQFSFALSLTQLSILLCMKHIMRTQIQQQDIPMTCRLKFCISINFFRTRITNRTAFQAFCTVTFTRFTQFISLHTIIPKYLQLFNSEIFCHQVCNPVEFNSISRKSYCLIFSAIYFHPIFYRPFPQDVQIFLQISMSCIFVIFYILQSSANNLIFGSKSNTRVDRIFTCPH